MIASSWWKVGLGLLGVTGVLASSGAGCGSGTTSSSSSETTSTSTTGTGGGGTGGGGTGGDATTTGTTSTTTTTTTTSSTSSSTSSTGTGMMKYETCAECTDLAKGAPADECNATHDACFANKNCVQIYNCVYVNPGCDTDAAGACCTFDCYEALKTTVGDPVAAQAAIDLYAAYSTCLYCTTCTTQCDAQPYCAAYAAGPGSCPP